MKDVVRKIDDSTSLSLRLQGALGFSLPPVIPLKETVVVKTLKDVEASADLQNRLRSGLKSLAEINYQTPVTLRLVDSKTSAFTLPVDPIISLSGKNIITRRYVSKGSGHGSIKERWSEDDWDITITGVLIAVDAAYLGEMTKDLRELCENGKNGLDLTCDFLNSYFDIQRIAVESYEFPFTKGAENQMFTIKAYSDGIYSLLELE